MWAGGVMAAAKVLGTFSVRSAGSSPVLPTNLNTFFW